jgi:hypothetical protein
MSDDRELTNCERLAAGAIIGVARELNRGCLIMEIVLSLHVIILVGALILLAFMWAGWIHFD